MQLVPTRTAVELTMAGLGVVTVGAIFQVPAAIAWGGAIWVGLFVARAVTLLGVAEIRASGFEMLWGESERIVRVGRGQWTEVTAEVRNRDRRAARYVHLRAVANPALEVLLEPDAGEVPAGGRLKVVAKIRGHRVGRHGVHGMSLDVYGSPGLFQVPLTFANPLGVEVLPQAYGALSHSARGGRSHHSADATRAARRRGDGGDLREIREHQYGDPFKRIAWRPSARRGKLLVRVYDLAENEVVWLVLDASVELWSGSRGVAPLDLAIDDVARAARFHIQNGDRVGIAIVAKRVLHYAGPDAGVGTLNRILEALARYTGVADADRNGMDEADAALRVLEHMSPLAPKRVRGLSRRDLDGIARQAEALIPRAPFGEVDVLAPGQRPRTLRRYLAAFGVATTARLEPDGRSTDLMLTEVLRRIAHERPKLSCLYLWSPLPPAHGRDGLVDAMARLRRGGRKIAWIGTDFEASLEGDLLGLEGAPARAARAVTEAVRWRTLLEAKEGRQVLARRGIEPGPKKRAARLPRRPDPPTEP
jgi:uncharacterized protein (DUF58 family)